MVKTIRQVGLKITVSLLKLLVRSPMTGWRRSPRSTTLKGR